MTSTEISIILMDDLLIVINDREKTLIKELPKEIEDVDKVELLKIGALMAFEAMRSSIGNLKGIALQAQAKSRGTAQA